MMEDTKTDRAIVVGNSIFMMMKGMSRERERKTNKQKIDEFSVHPLIWNKGVAFKKENRSLIIKHRNEFRQTVVKNICALTKSIVVIPDLIRNPAFEFLDFRWSLSR